MTRQLCINCFVCGYCLKRQTTVVSDGQLHSDFVRDVRNYAASLDIGYRKWHSFLIDAYQNHSGWISDGHGNEIFLDTEVFEVPNIDYWFREVSKPVGPNERPRLKNQARERFRVFATILKATAQKQVAMTWGAANDNEPQ